MHQEMHRSGFWPAVVVFFCFSVKFEAYKATNHPTKAKLRCLQAPLLVEANCNKFKLLLNIFIRCSNLIKSLLEFANKNGNKATKATMQKMHLILTIFIVDIIYIYTLPQRWTCIENNSGLIIGAGTNAHILFKQWNKPSETISNVKRETFCFRVRIPAVVHVGVWCDPCSEDAL